MTLALSLKHPPKVIRLALYRYARRRIGLEPAGHLDLDRAGWRGFVETGSALVRAGRFEEADRVLEKGLAAFPDDPGLLIEYASSAHHRALHREAITRWRRALAAAPQQVLCHVCLATNLRAIGETEAATAVIDQARRRYPKDSSLISEAARIAEAESRFADALGLWERVVARREPHPDWLRGHIHSLIVLGRFDEADRAVRGALARHPESQMLLAVEGILASSREDWPRAVSLWSAYRRRFPDDGTGWEHYGRAVQGSLLKAADDQFAAAPALTAPLKVDVVDDEAVRQLLLGFESIGDSCEFGSVQRRYAAEPLGLLRWNDVQLDDLLAALAQRFAGMGEPENTDMPVIGNGEYTIRDRRWSLWMHTFLFVGQTNPETLFPKMCRRVVYLRDKLLADLAAAEKIFVYRSPGINADRLEALHLALQAYGPIKLLAVQPADAPGGFAGAMPGEVVQVAERRWLGFISRLGVADGSYWDIAFEDWVSVCRSVAAQAS